MMVEQAEMKMVELGDSTSLIDRVVKQERQWSTKEEPCMAPVQGEPLPSNESAELPVSSAPHGLGTKNTDQMSTAQGRSSAAMVDQVKKDSAGSPVDFVVKLEPLWSAEDPEDQPPAVHSTVQPTAHSVSGLLPSLNRSHVCHHCFATFVLVSSLEFHIASAHGEELCVVLPVASSPDGREAGDYSRGNTDMLSGGKLVERIKSEVGHSDSDVRDGEKQNRQPAYEVFRKVFTEASDFEGQELIDTTQKRFRCDICNKTFTRAHCLKVHKLIHTGLKPFKCDVCGRAFIRFTLLKSHKLTHTSLNPHVCDVCGKAFTKGEHLKIHKRIHTGERPYKCPHCTSDFKAPCHLKRHVLSIHAGKKPYVCNVCGMGFAVNGHLKRHERIHTGEKPYTCDVCGMEFTQGSHLKKHQKVHTVDKPHVCGICGETFAKNGQLARHKMTHPSENLTCADCGKMFTRTNALKCHRLIHTGEKPHTCPHCPAAFTQSGSLKRHVRNLHP